MKTILNYIKLHGNKTFDEFEFNEVDGLILTEISYLSLDSYLTEHSMFYLKDLFALENQKNLLIDFIGGKRGYKLMTLLKDSKRFADCKIAYLRNKFSLEDVEQFFAVTFVFPEFVYVAYRGTDITFLGWKENLNMSYLSEIPSQRDAVIYLNDISKKYNLPLYVGGHSKGGNLAVYAAMYCQPEISDRIVLIQNFDGPGFYKNIYDSDEFKKLSGKIITVTTREALVGLLLYHTKDISFVNAKGFSFLSHDPFNWEVTKAGRLKRVKKNNIPSRWFQRSVRIFFHLTTENERENFVNLLFKLIIKNERSNVLEVASNPVRWFKEFKMKKRTLTQEENAYFNAVAKKFTRSFRVAIKQKMFEVTTRKTAEDYFIQENRFKNFNKKESQA